MNSEIVFMLSRTDRKVKEYLVKGRPRPGRITLQEVLPFSLSAETPADPAPFETRDDKLFIYATKAEALRENTNRLQATIVYYSDVLAGLERKYEEARKELSQL